MSELVESMAMRVFDRALTSPLHRRPMLYVSPTMMADMKAIWPDFPFEQHVRVTDPLPFGSGPMDWPEDERHENGGYLNKCCHCELMFVGHKRRVSCRLCSPLILDEASDVPAHVWGETLPPCDFCEWAGVMFLIIGVVIALASLASYGWILVQPVIGLLRF